MSEKYIDYHHASLIQMVKDLETFKNLDVKVFESIILALEERITEYCNTFKRIITTNDTETMKLFIDNYEKVIQEKNAEEPAN
jgi:hypothetical protein